MLLRIYSNFDSIDHARSRNEDKKDPSAIKLILITDLLLSMI